MNRLERFLFTRSLIIGLIVTGLVVAAHFIGLLTPMDELLYDRRARDCQYFQPPPTTQLVHLDIDDRAIDAIGRWPWPRATLARLLDEVRLARPKAVALDILLSEPQPPRIEQQPDGSYKKIDDDADLADALARSGKVILATSFNLAPAQEHSLALSNAVDWFSDDLELSQDDFSKRLIASGQHLSQSDIDDLYIRARRLAMHNRVTHELDLGPASLDDLVLRLLPHAQVQLHTPVRRLLEDEYASSLAIHKVYDFGTMAPPMAIPPAHGTLDNVPISAFSSVAASCGFTNYDIFDNATLRSVPLFVEERNHLFPQMGLALACEMLDANPRDVRMQGNTLIIPHPGGKIEIPTYTFHSRTLGADVSMIAAIPWFGTGKWETMYDWPEHKEVVGHISIAKIWDIERTRESIARNNAKIDQAISNILGKDGIALDPGVAERYATTSPALEDTAAREAMAGKTLKTLNESGWLDQYARIPDKELTNADRVERDFLYRSVDALHTGVEQNRDLRLQLDSGRAFFAGQLRGKGVLIGYVATGVLDRVNTSLDPRCPGVVVHGVIANAVLTNRWWKIAPSWIVVLITVIFGLLATASDTWLSPRRATIVALGLVIGYWLINGLLLFDYMHYCIAVAPPMVCVAAVWAMCVLDRLVIEGVERIRIAAHNEIFKREMALARKVQFALIPQKAPEIDGLNADGWTLPADETGGDCFDLWQLPDGRLGVLVADASGHGLAPAMIVSQVRTLVHMLSEYESSPQTLLERVNSRLALDLEVGRFVTAFLAFLRPDGHIDWASAGHGPMFWCASADGEMQKLESTGLPLGVDTDWLGSPADALQLEISGWLMVCSDGIYEAPKGASRELFGDERVQELLKANRDAPTNQIIAAIRDTVQAWQGKKEPADDQTIVFVRRVAQSRVEVTADSGAGVETVSSGVVEK